MAETPAPVRSEDPLPVEARLRALALGGDAPAPDPRLAAVVAELAALAADLAADRVQVRDLEKALVERIADVDDDRRTTASQLHRAWQTQREELAARLRRQRHLGILVLLPIGGLALAALLATVLRTPTSQAPLAEPTGQPDRVAGIETRNAQLQERLESLSDAVARLSATLGPLALPDLVDRIDRLAADQARLDRELQALRAAPTAGTASAGQPPDPAPTLPQSSPAGQVESEIARNPFALQLMGSYRREAVEALASRAVMPERVFVREESVRGRPWFVLIYGLYPSRAAAQAALNGLPPDLLTVKPFIRALPADAVLETAGRGAAR